METLFDLWCGNRPRAAVREEIMPRTIWKTKRIFVSLPWIADGTKERSVP